MRRLIPLLLLAPVIWASSASQVFEIYDLQGADGRSALEVIRELAGPDSTVTADPDRDRILVVAEPDAHERIRDAMAKLRPEPLNIRIEIDMNRSGMATRSETGISGSGVYRRTDGIGSTRIELEPHILRQRDEQSGIVNQFVLTANGRTASFTIQKLVKDPLPLYQVCLRNGWIVREPPWREVTTGMMVTPLASSSTGMIRVQLTPYIADASNPGDPLRLVTLASDVVVYDGQPFRIGGFANADSEARRYLFGHAANEEREQTDISLTATIVKAGAHPDRPGERGW